MKVRRIAATLIGLIICTGCEQGKYEIVHAGSQTFVLNKDSGEAQLIDGVSLIKVKSPDAPLADQTIKQAKTWPSQDLPQLGSLKLTVRTKYRDGKLMYFVAAMPFKGRLEREYMALKGDFLLQPTLYLDLSDEDGFPVGVPIELKVRGGGATRVVDEKGEPFALSWTGSQAMGLDSYRAITSQSVRWAGFEKE